MQTALWQQFAVDAGFKYHGLFLHVEYFQRLLSYLVNEFNQKGISFYPVIVKGEGMRRFEKNGSERRASAGHALVPRRNTHV